MSKTQSILKRFSLLREYKVVSNLELTVDGEKIEIDHLLIGEFGVLNLCTINKKGDLYGNENDEIFALVDKKLNREQIPNLSKKAQKNEQALRKIFAKEKVYNVKMDSVVVIEHSGCNPMISSPAVPILKIPELKKHLNCGKYDLDNKADKGKILETILKYK